VAVSPGDAATIAPGTAADCGGAALAPGPTVAAQAAANETSSTGTAIRLGLQNPDVRPCSWGWRFTGCPPGRRNACRASLARSPSLNDFNRARGYRRMFERN
jgi:hypothetical protein